MAQGKLCRKRSTVGHQGEPCRAFAGSFALLCPPSAPALGKLKVEAVSKQQYSWDLKMNPNLNNESEPPPSVVPRAEGNRDNATGIEKEKLSEDEEVFFRRITSPRRCNSVGDIMFPTISTQGRRNSGVIDLSWDDEMETSYQLLANEDRRKVLGKVLRQSESAHAESAGMQEKKRKRLNDSVLGQEEDAEPRSPDPEGVLLLDVIKKVTQISNKMKSYSEQNTKRELKFLIKQLEMFTCTLSKQSMREFVERKSRPASSITTETAEKLKEEIRRLTDQNRILSENAAKIPKTCPECSAQTQEQEEITDIDEITNVASWATIADRKWAKDVFKKTEIKVGNPLDSRAETIKVVFVETNDKSMDEGVQLLYKEKYPELADSIEEYDVLEQTSRLRSKSGEKTGVKIIKIALDDTDAQLWNGIQKVRSEVVREEVVALHMIRMMSPERLRKMAEAIFQKDNITVNIYTPYSSPYRTTGARTRRERQTYALVVENAGKTFQQTLDKIKEKMKGKEAIANAVKTIKEARDGKLIIVTDKDRTAVHDLKKCIEDGEVPNSIVVREKFERKAREILHLKGMDATCTKEEIVESLNRELETVLADDEYKLGELRPFGRNMRAVTLTIEEKSGAILLNKARIRIGLVRATVDKHHNIERCFRCWEFGHGSGDCKGPDRSGLCFQCGNPGHTRRECRETVAKCLLCQESGHATGTYKCHSFKEALLKTRKAERRLSRAISVVSNSTQG